MSLASVTVGHGIPATFLHGFTQTHTSWLPVADRLPSLQSILVDAPGHGGSPDGRRNLWQCAGDIHQAMPPGLLVGYSMGARMALHCALAHPGPVAGLVLVSGTPGIESRDERDQRRASDNSLADHIEEVGTARFIHEWLANPMFAGLSDDMRMVDARLANDPSGLADSLRHAGTGTQDNLWPRLGELKMPVLVIAGADDEKFCDIARRMAGAVPTAELSVIRGAGHTVHLEMTDKFCAVLADWAVRKVRLPDPRRT